VVGGIVSAAIQHNARPAPSLGGASVSNGSGSGVGTTPDHVSDQPAGASSAVSATDSCKELSVDFDAALRGRLATGLSSDEAHVYACGDLTRQACLTAGIAAMYSSVPTNPLDAV